MVLRASSHRNPVPRPPLFICLSTLHSKACPPQVAGLFAVLPFRPLLAAVEKSTVLNKPAPVCNLGYARLHEELGSKGHSSLTSWFSSSPWQPHLYCYSNKEEQMLWNQLEFDKCVWDDLKLQERYWYIVMWPYILSGRSLFGFFRCLVPCRMKGLNETTFRVDFSDWWWEEEEEEVASETFGHLAPWQSGAVMSHTYS